MELLKTGQGKHGGALGRSCAIFIRDCCALVTAKDCKHGVLRNGEDELPTSRCCSGKAGKSPRRIRVQLELHLHTPLSKRLVGKKGAARVPRQAVETENDWLGLRRSSRTLLPDCPKPCGQANAAPTVRPDSVNPEFPGALA